jgi:hypothetical protein
MNPVLFAPVSPCAPAITPNYTALLCDPEFKNVIKSLVITLANEDIDFRESLKDVFDYHMATSELRVLKRLSVVETDLGHNDLADFEEEHVPTIPEQIKELSDRIEQPLNNSPKEIEPEVTVIETTLDKKACALVEYLKTEAKPNDFGQFVIGRKDLETFMQNTIEEGLRVKNVSRQLKADLFERAVKLFPNVVYIQRSKSGNKTKMLALKTSAMRKVTHTLTRKAPLGILI